MKWVTLETIAEVNPRKPANLDVSQLCTFVPMESVDDWSARIVSPTERIVKEVERGYTYFGDGDVLFAKITPCMENGKCALAHGLRNNIGFGSTEFHVIRAGEMVSPEWIYYFIRQETVRQEAKRHMTGSAGQQRVPASFVAKIEVPLPTLPEQQRIAGILSRADRLRRLRRYALEMSDTYLHSVFLEMFGDPVANSKKWQTKELRHIAAINRGRFSPRPRSDPKFYGGVYPFIQTGDIARSNGFLRHYSQTLNSAGIKVSRAFDVGTVVIAIVGATIGETAILGIRTYCPDSVIGIRINPEEATPEFIEHQLRFWKPIFRMQAPETARANINLETLRPLAVAVPSLSKQQAFSEIVYRHERQCAEQREALRQAEHLFQTLLHEAFVKND